jgi:hypothetical protein
MAGLAHSGRDIPAGRAKRARKPELPPRDALLYD